MSEKWPIITPGTIVLGDGLRVGKAYVEALLADREALVRYVRANNEFYGRWPAQIRSAWEELPKELREEISE